MAFLKYLGRYLFVTTFVLAALLKFADTDVYAQSFLESYVGVHALFAKQFGFKIPFTPQFIAQHVSSVIHGIAVVQLLASAMIVFRYKLGSLLIVALLIFIDLACHNPWACQEAALKPFHARIFTLNLALLAGGFLTFKR